MALSADAYKTLIVAEVGDVGGVVAGQIDTLWAKFDGVTDLYLHYLYAKRSAIEFLQGHVRDQVDMTGDNNASAKFSQKLAALQTMWGNITREIAALEAKAREDEANTAAASNRPASGTLINTAPISAPIGMPDANDYRGSPYRRRR